MATQKYRSRLDKTVGENAASPTKVPGYGRPVAYRKGGENATPAPTGPVTTPEQARATSWGRSGGAAGDNPGKNGFGGRSSVNPGERAGPATVNPQASTDGVLDSLVRGGVAALDNADDWQTRRLDDTGDKNLKSSPVHPAMTKRSVDNGRPGGTIPAKNGNPTSDWDARRSAALMRAK
jgi:hypothetical protein